MTGEAVRPSAPLARTAVVWGWALNGISGLVKLSLQDLGLIHQPVVWLADSWTTFLATVPVAIVFSWFQRYLVTGLGAGAVK